MSGLSVTLMSVSTCCELVGRRSRILVGARPLSQYPMHGPQPIFFSFQNAIQFRSQYWNLRYSGSDSAASHPHCFWLERKNWLVEKKLVRLVMCWCCEEEGQTHTLLPSKQSSAFHFALQKLIPDNVSLLSN